MLAKQKSPGSKGTALACHPTTKKLTKAEELTQTSKEIDGLMACTACLVCLISTVIGCSKKNLD